MTMPSSSGFSDALAGRDGTQAVFTPFRPNPVYPDPMSATSPRVQRIRSSTVRQLLAGIQVADVIDAPAGPVRRPPSAQPTPVRQPPPGARPVAWAGPTASPMAGAPRQPALPPGRQPTATRLAPGTSQPAPPLAPSAPTGPYASIPAAGSTSAVARRPQNIAPAPGQGESDAQRMLRNAMRQFQQQPTRSRTQASPKSWIFLLFWLALLAFLIFGSGWTLITELINRIFH